MEQFIIQLVQLSDKMKVDVRVLLAAKFEDVNSSDQNYPLIHKEDPKVLLTRKIYTANACDLSQCICSI